MGSFFFFGDVELHHRQTPHLYGPYRFTDGRKFRLETTPSDNFIDIWDPVLKLTPSESMEENCTERINACSL